MRIGCARLQTCAVGCCRPERWNSTNFYQPGQDVENLTFDASHVGFSMLL